MDITLPMLASDTRMADDYVEARRQHWVARSDRGLEVLRYRQGSEILNHPELEKGPAFLKRLDDIGLTSGRTRDYWERNLICNEGDVRARLRVPLAQLFRPAQMAKLQKQVRAIVETVLDDIADPSDVDFMEQIAWRIPSQVYCLLVSAPFEQAPSVAHLSDTILAPILTCDKARLQDSIDAVWAAHSFVEEHIEARRANLGDDFTSVMIRQQQDGLLSEDELILQGMNLLQASMDNTVHQLGLTFGTLLEDRDRWAQLIEKPALTPVAMEETFRLRPRFGTIFRYASNAVAYEDVVIPADSWVFVSVRSAGRDETKFDDADAFRFGRPSARALMFGAGPYNCLGQTLARLEITELIRAIIARYPNIRMLGDWQTFDTNAVSESARLRISLL